MRAAALTLGLWAAMSFGQSLSTVYLFGHGTAEGMMYEFSIAGDRAEKLPRWVPSNDPLPLPTGTAVQTAEAWMKARNPEIKQFELATVAIAQMSYPSTLKDRWYYRIDFNPIVGGQRLHGGQFTAVVLFDNTIVEPRARKQVEVR